MKVRSLKDGEEYSAWKFDYIDDYQSVPKWVEQLDLDGLITYQTCGSEWSVSDIGYAKNGDYLLKDRDESLLVVHKDELKEYETISSQWIIRYGSASVIGDEYFAGFTNNIRRNEWFSCDFQQSSRVIRYDSIESAQSDLEKLRSLTAKRNEYFGVVRNYSFEVVIDE